MAELETSVLVGAPLHEVYNQWTQFEEFPKFMEGVTEVRQLDDKRLNWKANIGGAEREWQADIVEQIPDRRIVWKNVSGTENSGTVSFEDAAEEGTRVTLALVYEPEGIKETIGDALGIVSRRVKGDLERFKEFMEERQRATGGWRGQIDGKDVQPA